MAALVDGGLFGIIHFSGSGVDGLLILPPLAVLGVIFCLVYEKTGSLLAPIGMHAFNNAVAFGVQADDGWKVSVVVGAAGVRRAGGRGAPPASSSRLVHRSPGYSFPRMRRSLTLPAVTVIALCGLPAAVSAQTPPAQPSQVVPPATPPPSVVPPAQKGKVSIRLAGGQVTRKARYIARGAAFRVGGTVKPLVAGQVVLVEVLRKGKVVSRQSARVGAKGRIRARVKTRRGGTIKVRLRHVATPQQLAFKSRSATVKVVSLAAGQGSRGTKVWLLQRGLYKLGYAVPRTGVYDPGTSRAVLAFRKTNGMGRDGFATRGVYSRVLQRSGAFKARFPKAGRHVEFDWSRQVLALFDSKGRVSRTYHASSGAPSTPDRVRALPLLPPRHRHQRQGHGARRLLHRRLRHPRLRLGAQLPRQPRLHPHPGAQRPPGPRRGLPGRADLRLPLAGCFAPVVVLGPALGQPVGQHQAA